MSINGQQIINIGLPNESIGSDSLYEAFNKTEDNFTTLFTCASPYTNFVALTGIGVTSNANTGTVSITNTGVTNIVAGTNITINQSNGNVTISSTGGGNGGGSGTVTSVGLAPVSNSRIVVTNSPIVSSGNIGIDLATTGVVPGTYTAPTVTLDAYGRITSAANTTSSGTVTSVGIIPGSGIGVASSPVTTVGNMTVTNTGVVRLTAGLGITLSAPNGIVQVSSVYTGTVTSVGISSNTLTVSSSPITASGNIAVELPSSITLSGNITAANANLGNLVTANFFTGDGGLLSNLAGAVGTQTTIANGTSNVRVFTNGNVTTSVAGNANIVIVTGTGANIAGTANISGNANVGNIGASSGVFTSNVTAGNIYANSGTIGASLLAGTLTTAAQPNITSVGTLTSLNSSGTITAPAFTANTGIFTGNGSGLSAIAGANVTGVVASATTAATASTADTVTTAAQPNITSVGTLSSLAVTGNVVAGNLYANSGTLGVAILNVSGISNLNAVGNVRISGGSANQILKTDGAGNLTWVDPNGGYYLHTQNSSSSTWTVTHNLNRQYVTVEAIDANGNSYTGRYDYPTINYTNANALTMTFTSAVQGYAAVTGGGTNINSVSVGNSTPGGVNTQVQFNDAGALAGSSGLVYNKTTGTLTATLYAGSGANLTNIAGANVTGAVSSATTAATVTTAAQPNITSVGTLANLNVSGNVSFTGSNVSLGSNANVRITGGSSGQILSTDGSGNLSWVPTGTATTAATVTTNAQPNITSVGTLTSLSVSGNISGANLTGNHFGNGASLSSITGANVTGTVANATTVTGATQNNITTLGALTVLSSGANTTAGTITGNWSLSTGSRLSATYADLAEYYQADATYEPGTVLMFGGDNEVTLAEEATNRVAGVVSTNPAYAMNSGCPDIAVAIALQGRVPCKVQGTVRKGDMMISAGSGYAVACSEPRLGQVIGKALENFDLIDGVIEIVVGRL